MRRFSCFILGLSLLSLLPAGCSLQRSGLGPTDAGVVGMDGDTQPPACSADRECDDGFFCNGFEICSGGTCISGSPPRCNDDFACTVEVCDEAADECLRLPDHAECGADELCSPSMGCVPMEPCASDAECDDGFVCNGPERCADDRCVPGAPPECDDATTCTIDACSEALDGCVNTPDARECAGDFVCDPTGGCVPPTLCVGDADCDDGNFCDGAERCVDGRCAAGTPPDCGDGVACTVDACDDVADACVHVADDSLCPLDRQCIPPGGCTFVGDCTSDADCDDGFFCNGVETCSAGRCVGGMAPSCGDAVACTVDFCDEVAERCANLVDDSRCASNETCDAVMNCVPECTVDADCDDGQFCNGAEACVAGACAPGAAPSCGDAVTCTTDLCDETADVCRNVPDDAACGASETCNATMGCVPECAGDGDCDDGLFCNGAETCVSGGCMPGTAPSCGDAVTCTIDGCDETADVCRNLPDDGMCGASETCSATMGCVPECTVDADCDDGQFCNGAETCVSGGCMPGTAPSCGDAVMCTIDGCDETADVCRNIPDDGMCGASETCSATMGCVPECAADGDCDDGQFCNGAETCVSGGCMPGTAPSCGDAVMCTTDLCDETAEVCRNVPDDTACGASETCNATMGCVPECAADGDCDDGQFCNGAETCVSGGCMPGTAPSCGDAVMCTTDLCDETADVCRNVPDDTACGASETCNATMGCVPECAGDGDCDDGQFCNGAETCVSGGCMPGTAPSCGDAVMCTTDLCDETADVCRNVPDDTACGASETCNATMGCVPECAGDGDCDDGLFCNGAEACVAGGCMPGTAPDCDDAVMCTTDICDETTDVCRNLPDDSACTSPLVCTPSGCGP